MNKILIYYLIKKIILIMAKRKVKNKKENKKNKNKDSY